MATIACSVLNNEAGSDNVALFSSPDTASEILREIPVGDLVFYPDVSLAPARVDGWAWVRHDMSQTAIWQNGEYGWVAARNLSDCG